VQAVRHGMTNGDIARRRGVSLDAVKQHVASAIAKLELSGRRALRTWDGVPRRSNLARQEKTMATAGLVSGVWQIARTVRDVVRSERWYREVLGLTHLYTFGTMTFFDCGGVRLMLSQQDPVAAESIIYFRVADIRTAHETMQARGVEVIGAPHLIHTHADGTEEWMMFVNDSEGRPLGLMASSRPDQSG